jgi:hypothetical protein
MWARFHALRYEGATLGTVSDEKFKIPTLLRNEAWGTRLCVLKSQTATSYIEVGRILL